jgi:hypothetical protein
VSSSLDVGMKESLNELVYKSLVKLCKQPEPPLESIDDTVLKWFTKTDIVSYNKTC